MQNIKCKTEVITLTHSSSTPLCLWPTQTTRYLRVGQKMGTVKDQLLAKLVIHNKMLYNYLSIAF